MELDGDEFTLEQLDAIRDMIRARDPSRLYSTEHLTELFKCDDEILPGHAEKMAAMLVKLLSNESLSPDDQIDLWEMDQEARGKQIGQDE